VLEFTRALSATPPEVDSALRARLQEHFISEDFDALAAVIARANAQARSQVALEHLPASDAAPTGVPSREERSS
jgi:alkylhydroperoxidase family enzyme